ncbi:unnamed protein product [Adineta steineri]|uniref:NAD(P)(+)--arginine ADP-ribosyltransferase n=1 Tax=Adineta steineri TaxID=433720 RepID=A0A813X2Y5_9BILA|nr:unnamed protein product [Adineta steineri]CAF0869753.1 unnamed protein product [Adineta steineri]CAF1015155.1 unnamed protein product [Adineta steineri]
MQKYEGRQVVDVLKDLCAYNPTAAKDLDRLPHDCYMIEVGGLTQKKDLENLENLKESMTQSNESLYSDEDQGEYTLMNSEELEFILEKMELAGSTQQLENERQSHYVFEDNFNASLQDMIKSKASYERLKKVCYRYENREGENVDSNMINHEKRVQSSYKHFLDKNVPVDEAKAMAFALSFYTGPKSESCSRAGSLVARKGNFQTFEKQTDDELNEASIILYYMVKALSYIPFYWGYVTRACQLKFDELTMYQPGRVVTWIQFSSSKKGKKGHDSAAFKDRNTLFKIYSLTGRPIKKFSNYEEEDEVLFLPHSTFIVFNRTIYKKEGKQVIYMRQVELGFCKWSVLWVDDRIFDEQWENKKHMEYAAVRALDVNVHFIPKSSTNNALSFLRSPFGQRLKNKDTFRIVTDMNRENESPTHNAGARLIKAVRKLGFKNQCLIFTSDKENAEDILHAELSSKELQGVFVSVHTKDLRNFVNFDQTPTPAQQSNIENPAKHSSFSNSINSKNNTSGYGASASAQANQSAHGYKHAKSHAYTDNEMMHNSRNTDIDILLKNCQMRNLINSRQNCVLITTGSFNPVHPFHFQNLLRVKEYLEHEHQPPMNVVAGYISPTHDSYVHSKLGDPAWIPVTDRCRLCEEAVEYEGSKVSSWIAVSRGESEWKDGFVDFGPVTENLRDYLNSTLVEQENILKYPLRIIYVCGLDHYNKCSYVERMAQQNNMSCAIIFRQGYDEQQINRSLKTANVIYISLSKERTRLPDVSSTQIRQYFENPNPKNMDIEKYMYPSVRDYMKRKYRKK